MILPKSKLLVYKAKTKQRKPRFSKSPPVYRSPNITARSLSTLIAVSVTTDTPQKIALVKIKNNLKE